MARMASGRRRELLDRWRVIQEEMEEEADAGGPPAPAKHRRLVQNKEEWFSDCFDCLVTLPKEEHIWCGYPDMMGPLLETFHGYFTVEGCNSPLTIIWKRLSQELDVCTQCVCQHHQAQEYYDTEYRSDTVDPLLKVLRLIDEERVTEHLKRINTIMQKKQYDPSCHSAEVVTVMFEVLMYPVLLDDQLLANQFQVFIETIDDSYEVSLSTNQQYPGVYALLFFKSGKARAIGLRLARSMGKLRRATDLQPLQPLLSKYINFLEVEVLPSTLESSRPRLQLERADVWLGFKSFLGFLEAVAFEDGILERYPIFLNIVLNHVSDDTSDLSCAVSCLKASFEMLGCKLWLRTALSPSVMRNTLLGQCFHTRDEKSHKEIFDLFLPFLQSLEALQDGEHEKQRRNILYFLLHQVTRSSNFSALMRKNACKIALLIVQRGYTMDPPSPPSECAHVWGPSLISSLNDTSLHNSLRQPAFDLINVIIISDASALIAFKVKYQSAPRIDVSNSVIFVDDEDELPFFHDAEEKESSCWNDFSILNKLTSHECKDWRCIPLLWYLTMIQADPSMLPIAFSKAVFWALSHISVLEPGVTTELSVPVNDWLLSHAREVSSSFSWQVPKGSDDGGDGKESNNSLKVSTICTLLLRIFKRFSTHFIMQIERRELQKQWTWEPMMAESLILSLTDNEDNVRQAGRAILEHVSQEKGLTPGLKFLCSSASSLSAAFLGLRYAIGLVDTKPIMTDFHNLHQLFFVICKLLREVVAPRSSVSQPIKPPSEGGFLRQPFSGFLISPPEQTTSVVDIVSWEKFSVLLSAILWPFILTCLEKGEELINSKQCQIACVRLLELLPIVYERVSSCASPKPCNMIASAPNFLDLTWLCHLLNWGKSSLLVIIRHWKNCMISSLERLKVLHGSTMQQNIDALAAVISHDALNIDELKESVSNLKLTLSKEGPTETEKRHVDKPFSTLPSRKEHASKDRQESSDKVVDVEIAKPSDAISSERVILLSDSEEEDSPAPDLANKEVLSSVGTKDDESNSTDMLREQVKSRQPRKVGGYSQVSVNQQIGDPVSDGSAGVQSKDSRDRNVPLKGIGRVKTSSASSSTTVGLKKAKSSVTTASGQPSVPTPPDTGKFKSIFRDISEEEDDPLEHALDSCQRPQITITKPNIIVPKRQVVKLPLSTGNKHGYLSRMDAGARRLKPPRLDSWYKRILELDYFAVVGLSSSDKSKKKDSAALRHVPERFDSQGQYVEIFQPLVLEEFKAQLQNTYLETPPDDMICGSISILSVERVDDFLIVRGRPEDTESVASRGCAENDLILLTKEPLRPSEQQVHVLGKVERREKSDKNKGLIFVMRFFLSNENARLTKVKRLLVERSKWFLNRIMSMTSQFREFSALSSLNDIPVLPVILNPVSYPSSYDDSIEVQLDKLPQPMQKVLKSSFNDSQLKAVSVAVGSVGSKTDFELSLIQGPPGTGKTRTIVAIVSALLTLHADNSSRFPRSETQASFGCTNARAKISQSAAIAIAWQDAAFARQMIKDSQKESPRMTERPPKGRALICAQSNAAVDELVSRLTEGLYGSDGKLYKPYIVRVGNAKTVHPSSLPFFIDTLVEQRLADDLKVNVDGKNCSGTESSSSLRAKLEKVVDRIRYYESKRKLMDGDTSEKSPPRPNEDEINEISDDAIGAKLNVLYSQKKAICVELAAAQAREKKVADESKSLKYKVRKSILKEAEIVVTTLSGSGGDVYGVCSESVSANKFGNFSEHTLFDVVVIDEAAQALEPATLIPLQLLKSKGTKCIMVGDPKQLPATVMSGLASKFLYECSMFERLQRAGHPVIMLTEQYRMHPEISRFPSLHFYENKLLDGAQMSTKSAPFHEHHCLGPYMFFDVTDGRERCRKGAATQSLCNESEADAAGEILKFLRKRYPSEFSCKRIGIITPYRSQLSLLRSRFTALFGPEIISDMELNTVDGFQGREVDILVLSTVRASDSSGDTQHSGEARSIGFVADVRRMNVALTRAKFSLWIVGNARTLQTNLHWATLIQNAKERDLFISVARPYSSIFGKVRSQSKETSGTLRSNSATGHPKQRGKDKITTTAIMSLGTSDGEVQKRKSIHAVSDLEKDTITHSPDQPSTGPKVSQNLVKSTNEVKPESRWDQRSPKGHGSMMRTERKPVKQNNSVEIVKGSSKRDAHQDAAVRRHSEQKKPIKQNDNVEMIIDSSKRDSDQDSLKRRHGGKTGLVKQNDSVEATKISSKQDAITESEPKKKDVNPSAHEDMKKLIKKAKGAAKSSEHPKSKQSDLGSSPSSCSGKGSNQILEKNKSKATSLGGQSDLIAARKRQREDVESLLSSSLISSKKPSSKHAAKKQK